MEMYLKVIGLLPGLEDGLEQRMILYLKVTRSSNPWRWSVINNVSVPQGHCSSPIPWRWSVIKNGTVPQGHWSFSNPWRLSSINNDNVPQGHWSSPRPWRWSGTIPWWPLVQNVSSSLANPQDFQPTQHTCSNLTLQKRESSWPKN